MSVPNYLKKTVRAKGKKPRYYGYVWLNGKEVLLGKWNSPESLERYQQALQDIKPGARIQAPTVDAIVSTYLSYSNAYYRKRNELTTEIHSVRKSMEVLQKYTVA